MSMRFLSVDLEVESKASLELICEEFGSQGVYELHHVHTEAGYLAAFELTAGGADDDADLFVAEFCRLVEGLSAPARELWEGAFRRTFDIGCQAAAGEASQGIGLSRGTLAKVVGVGASLNFTLYPEEPDQPPVTIL